METACAAKRRKVFSLRSFRLRNGLPAPRPSGRLRIFTFRRDQVPVGQAFALKSRLFGDAAAGFRRLVLIHAGGLHAFGDLARGQFGQRGKNQLRLAHVVAQVVRFHIHFGPFLMNDVGQNRVFLARLDVVIRPIIGQLVARFLPGHALLDPLLAAPVLLPGGAGAIQRQARVGHFLHPLVAHLRQPQLDRLGLGAGHRLHQAQQGFGGGDIGQALLAVLGGHFQLVTVCYQLAAFLVQTTFQHLPVFSGGLIVSRLRQHPNNVDHRKQPRLSRLVIHAADCMRFKNGWLGLHVRTPCLRMIELFQPVTVCHRLNFCAAW